MALNRRFLLCGLVCLALAAFAPGAARAEDCSGYIRLHVVASDDSAAEQALKLEVRDAVLDCARGLLGDCASADEAWRALNANRDALERVVRDRMDALGSAEPAACRLGLFAFPDRVYGDRLVPAGTYRALRVVIGEGRGHNWWCVLYPSLCYPEETLPDGPGEMRSILWDWLVRLFGGGRS